MLAAAHTVVIPIQCEYYGLEGISQLLNTVRLVQQNFNPGLAISGVLLTMYDSRLNLCRQVAEDAKEYFGAKVFSTPIPRNVRLAEAPSFGKPILLYDVQSVGAKSYLAVAQELMRRLEGGAVSVEQSGPVESEQPDGEPEGAQETEASAADDSSPDEPASNVPEPAEAASPDTPPSAEASSDSMSPEIRSAESMLSDAAPSDSMAGESAAPDSASADEPEPEVTR